MGLPKKIWLATFVYGYVFYEVLSMVSAACVPSNGCEALVFYNISREEQLNQIYSRFNTNLDKLRLYNTISNPDSVEAGAGIFIPFECGCAGSNLGHDFSYAVEATDTLDKVSMIKYHNLTDTQSIIRANGLVNDMIYVGNSVKVPVNCSCGNPDNSTYGLFMTYVVQDGDTSEGIAAKFNTTAQILRFYNPSVSLNGLAATRSRLFIPAKTVNGSYPPYKGEGEGGGSKSNTAVIAGVVAGGACAFILGSVTIFWFCVKRNKQDESSKQGLGSASDPMFGSTPPSAPSEFTVDKSVEFSYEELAAVTDNFNIAHQIGKGGYGAVFYGELRGLKLAIKKMNLQATKEFMSELKVLTRVHHTNLVQLIGYCTVESLFLVYEFVDNGTLAYHLRGSGLNPLSWNQRMQIALDSARGLEYIHEHTKPTYIHRDVKSPNILIDTNFRAKVADFGLTKLTESSAGGSASLTQPTKVVGTFGYMSPEYARYGDVSPKVDVYSFGVVLYEIISGKDAIVRHEVDDDYQNNKALVSVFDVALRSSEAQEKLKMLIDPALGEDYSFESVWKLAKLAEACTQETPDNRPNMRTVVVALMTLSSSTQEFGLSNNYSDSHSINGLPVFAR